MVLGYLELRRRTQDRDKSLREKVMNLEEAANLVSNGDHIALGGSTASRTSFALLWSLIRAKKKDLTFSRSIVSTEGDLIFASGIGKEIQTSWFSQGIVWGVSRVMRHFTENNLATYKEWSHMSMGLRYRAGAMGVPFMPMRSMMGSDVAGRLENLKEMILEGEILADVKEPEGPFGEFTGYASYRSTQNVFIVKKVQMRKDPIFHSIASGMSADHILISCVSREAEILNSLRRNLPNVKNVHVPSVTAGALLAIVSMDKTAEGQPQQAVMAALGTEFYCKCVVVVDDDVDIFNLSDVAWAIMTRTRADKDMFFIPGAMGAILDPTSDPDTHTLTKIGIDATKPEGKDFAERLFISQEQKERVREMLKATGLPLS